MAEHILSCIAQYFKLKPFIVDARTSLIVQQIARDIPGLICMKFRISLIIIIISLGQILLSYIANTSRTRMHPRECVHTPTQPSPSFRLSLFDGSVAPNRDDMLRW